MVEDNEDLRVLIAEILEKDYHIIQAGNGAAALERLNDENPDLILTDVMMPLVGGIELCRAVKQNIETSHIPVIMLTAKSGMENQIEGMEAVSYTHLDVYKRQVLLSPIPLICRGTPSHHESEAQQDVYKRQVFIDGIPYGICAMQYGTGFCYHNG